MAARFRLWVGRSRCRHNDVLPSGMDPFDSGNLRRRLFAGVRRRAAFRFSMNAPGMIPLDLRKLLARIAQVCLHFRELGFGHCERMVVKLSVPTFWKDFEE